MEGSRYGILRGSVGSERILSRVQTGRDVVFDVLESQFHQDGGESLRLDTADFLGTGKMMLCRGRGGMIS